MSNNDPCIVRIVYHFYLQLQPHLKPGEHRLSLDTDVLLWIESRAFDQKNHHCVKFLTLLLSAAHNILNLRSSAEDILIVTIVFYQLIYCLNIEIMLKGPNHSLH